MIAGYTGTITSRAGKLRALAVSTATRSSAAPEIPTVAEAGIPDYDANAWFGVFVPAGTPAAVIERLHTEISAIVRVPEVRARFLSLGGEPVAARRSSFLPSSGARWRNGRKW